MRLRTLMSCVAVAAFALAGLRYYVGYLVREHGDFAAAVIFFHAMGLTVLFCVALAIGFVVRLARNDQAYAASLRRRLAFETKEPAHAEGEPQARP